MPRAKLKEVKARNKWGGMMVRRGCQKDHSKRKEKVFKLGLGEGKQVISTERHVLGGRPGRGEVGRKNSESSRDTDETQPVIWGTAGEEDG